MTTINQLVKIKHRNRLPANVNRKILGKPQIAGSVKRVFVRSPKKPNSANRAVAHVFIVKQLTKITYYTFRLVTAHIPGEKHKVAQFNNVHLCGAGLTDLPGVHQRVVHGRRDVLGTFFRLRKRSKFANFHPSKSEWVRLEGAWTEKELNNAKNSPRYDVDGNQVDSDHFEWDKLDRSTFNKLSRERIAIETTTAYNNFIDKRI
jgi:small subunit ribosomal protein S12